MTRRVLVTGAGGFIGRHAIAPLLERGFEVHAVGRRPAEIAGARVWTADLLDPAAVAGLMAEVRPSHLLHLAWDVTHGAFWESRVNLDWVAASLSLYRTFVAHGGTVMTLAGTCAEYDWTLDMLEEDTPCVPATLYGLAKHSLHTLLRAAAGRDGVVLGWGRIFLLYGPHEGPERLVSSVARRLLAGEPAPVGTSAVQRDVMHVADVAGGLVAMLDAGHDGAVNVASGTPVSIGAVVGEIGRATGRGELIRLDARPPPPGEKMLLAASGARLRGLGFAPRYTLADGIAETVAWWRQASISGE